MISYDESHRESVVLAAGADFVEAVYSYGNGSNLSDDDAFMAVAKLYVEVFYVNPRQRPSRALAVFLADGEYTDALYLLAKAQLLGLDVRQRTAALIEKAIAHGDRDARDMAMFRDLRPRA